MSLSLTASLPWRGIGPFVLQLWNRNSTLERHHYGAGTIVMKKDAPELRTRQRYGPRRALYEGCGGSFSVHRLPVWCTLSSCRTLDGFSPADPGNENMLISTLVSVVPAAPTAVSAIPWEHIQPYCLAFGALTRRDRRIRRIRMADNRWSVSVIGNAGVDPVLHSLAEQPWPVENKQRLT